MSGAESGDTKWTQLCRFDTGGAGERLCAQECSSVAQRIAQLEQIVGRVFLRLAIDRTAWPLQAVVFLPQRSKFKKEAAESSRVRGFCLTRRWLGIATTN